MTTTQEMSRVRTQRSLQEAKQRLQQIEAQQVAEHLLAMNGLLAAIESATTRLGATDFIGGRTEKRWVGGMQTQEVAVWFLPTPLVRMRGIFYFAPTLDPALKRILHNPLGSKDSVREHVRNAALRQQNPAYHYAVCQRWLVNITEDLDVTMLEYLIEALDQL